VSTKDNKYLQEPDKILKLCGRKNVFVIANYLKVDRGCLATVVQEAIGLVAEHCAALRGAEPLLSYHIFRTLLKKECIELFELGESLVYPPSISKISYFKLINNDFVLTLSVSESLIFDKHHAARIERGLNRGRCHRVSHQDEKYEEAISRIFGCLSCMYLMYKVFVIHLIDKSPKFRILERYWISTVTLAFLRIITVIHFKCNVAGSNTIPQMRLALYCINML
jgi:hypothetical protein